MPSAAVRGWPKVGSAGTRCRIDPPSDNPSSWPVKPLIDCLALDTAKLSAILSGSSLETCSKDLYRGKLIQSFAAIMKENTTPFLLL